MRLRIRKNAARDLARLHPHDARRVKQKLKLLLQGGLNAPLDIRKLRNRPGYRLRVDSIRVIFRVEDDVIIIMALGPRGDVYKY